MRYVVEFHVTGYFSFTGKASSKEEAKRLALEAADSADFGDLQNVEYEIEYVGEEE